jgi:hypothetical protein
VCIHATEWIWKKNNAGTWKFFKCFKLFCEFSVYVWNKFVLNMCVNCVVHCVRHICINNEKKWTYCKSKSKAIPLQAEDTLRIPAGWDFQISRKSAHEGSKVVSPTHRPPLPPGNISGTHFYYKLNRPQRHSAAERIKSMKNVELSTLQLVHNTSNTFFLVTLRSLLKVVLNLVGRQTAA